MNTVEQDFLNCIEFQKSVGENTRSVIHNMENNLHHYENNEYHICHKCKAPSRCTYGDVINARMSSDRVCFGCDFWSDRLNRGVFDEPNVFVVDREMYSIGHEGIKRNVKPLGHGGCVFTLVEPDGTQHTTNNLWCGGDLPFWLVDGFKTAVFVNSDLDN